MALLPGLLAATVASCDATTSLPPSPEILVIVDTDALVPRLVSRLRVDAYTQDLNWYASRDFGLADPHDWPASFGLLSPKAGQTNVVLLRLRAYADGMTRDYRGERYQPRPVGGVPSDDAPLPTPPANEAPRLLGKDGQDETPPLEPEPLVTIDRLVILETRADTLASVRVVLHGACFGTMADLYGVETCVDTEDTRVSLTDPSPLTPGTTLPRSAVGTFGAETPCTEKPRSAHDGPSGTPLYDQEVCTPGGAFLFGSELEYGMFDVDLVPERVAVVDPFLVDAYEVTVARWRQAESEGRLPGVAAIPNDGPIPTSGSASQESSPLFCTYSTTPMGREDYPINCVSYDGARAFCQSEGGDLPREVQWEYLAAQFGRTFKTPFPWGGGTDDVPCSQAVFGRGYDLSNALFTPLPCETEGLGPVEETRKDGDVSIGLGVKKLAGSVTEWMKDSLDSFGSNCWMEQPLHMPTCVDATQPNALRGGNWSDHPDYLYYGVRRGNAPSESTPFVGFRCARPGVASAKKGGP